MTARSHGGNAQPGRQGWGKTNEAHIFRYVKDYRKTGNGGITYPVAVCLECRSLVEPYAWRLSRPRTHGELYYRHEHELSFMIFYQSNVTHNRNYVIEGRKESWMAAIGEAWRIHELHLDNLKNYIDLYLSESPPERG